MGYKRWTGLVLGLLLLAACLLPAVAAPPAKGKGKGKGGAASHPDAYGDGSSFDSSEEKEPKEETNLFMKNWHLEARVVGSFLIAILCGTMVLEWAVHYMEHRVEDAVRRLLDRVYKELALLGIISFTLFMINTFGNTLDYTMYLAFEVAHLLIFFLALAYILQAGLLIGAIMPMRRRLEKMNTRAAADDRVKYQKAYWGFRIFRAKFIEMHSLPKNFMYDLYHLQSYKSYVTESLEVAPYCWMSIVIVFIVHVLVASYYKKVSDFLLDGKMFLVYGWLILGVVLAVYFIVARVHRTILKNLTFEQKAAKRVAGITNNEDSIGRKALHLTKASSELKKKAHDFHHGSHAVHSVAKKHHHMSVIDLDETTLVSYGGFTRRQHKLFKAGQDLLLVYHCLYLSAYFMTYIGKDFKESSSPVEAAFLIALTPIPILIAMLILGPGLITRYLLIMSLSRVNLEALEEVCEYMEDVEDAFESIVEAMEGEDTSDMATIFARFDTEGHGVLSHAEFKRGLQEHWGLRFSKQELRALTRFLDTDNSGFIDLEEFMKLTHGDEIFDRMSGEAVNGESKSAHAMEAGHGHGGGGHGRRHH